MAAATKSNSTAATDNTVFVRFMPASVNIRRHHLEDLFSNVGPIRKSSVIVPRANKKLDENENETANRPPASYGFIKYTSDQDAIAAASKFDHASLRISATEVIKLRVERASDAAAAKSNKKRKNRDDEQGESQEGEEGRQSSPSNKANRLILRNLSFYAKESHIRKALETQFGTITEVHIPQVPGDGKQKTHRGFCFVTFERGQDAKACLKADSIVIQKRSVLVAQALNKTMYENQKQSAHKNKKTPVSPTQSKEEEMDQSKDEENQGDDDSSNVDDDESSEEQSEAADDDHDDDESVEDGEKSSVNRDENAVAERRALFVRNLPFDSTRHDLFELFRSYGYITGIFLVKDRDTGIPKGTAFVSYRSKDSVTKALDAARGGNDNFVSQREETENQTMETEKAHFTLKGRQIFINAALDKGTAETLVLEKSSDRHSSGKDRRNLYLKGEGRVDNDEENDLTPWDDLPEQDKSKRQRAWSEKNTKLRSPIFFINPTRLSIRNLAKEVDEQEFKQLCADATKRGLEKKLVNAEDIIAHWRASGDMTTREIMAKVEEEGDSIVLPFEEKNMKRLIPSVFIDRDFSGAKKGPSRGFGFVEFGNHAHALACLREMNNNTNYSEVFAAGGRHAMELRKKSKKRKGSKSIATAAENDFVGGDGQVKVPRLIVEFAVENKAKARLQAEHRAQQQANKIKQRIENKEKTSKSDKKKEKKKSRGARQRERKRLGFDQMPEKTPKTAQKGIAQSKRTQSKEQEKERKQDELSKPVVSKKPKITKPPKKKRKMDDEEAHFEKLVKSYKTNFAEDGASGLAEDGSPQQPKKRWFED